METTNIKICGPFQLERGVLPWLEITYSIAGTPNKDGSNVVFICPPFTADSDVTKWWPSLFGHGKYFDPKEYCLLCAAPLGSAYGTSGPMSPSQNNRGMYYNFPEITVRDISSVNIKLLEKLSIPSVNLLIGASLGGMVALEMAISASNSFRNLAVIATSAEQSQYMAAYSESQRQIIELDPTWGHEFPNAGHAGLSIARSVAILSYRPYLAYARSQIGRDPNSGKHRSVSYQKYKGIELANRFNAISYHRLLGAFDSHDIGRDRGGIVKALNLISAKTIVLSLSNDQVFPIQEQQLLSENIPKAGLEIIETEFGHDGFLIESEQITAAFDRYGFSNTKGES